MTAEDGFDITKPLSAEDISQLEKVVKMAEDAIPTIEQAISAGLEVESQLEQVKVSRDQATRLLVAFKPRRTRQTKAR